MIVNNELQYFTWTCEWCGAELTSRDKWCPCREEASDANEA